MKLVESELWIYGTIMQYQTLGESMRQAHPSASREPVQYMAQFESSKIAVNSNVSASMSRNTSSRFINKLTTSDGRISLDKLLRTYSVWLFILARSADRLSKT